MWFRDSGGWIMRIAVSAVLFLVALLVGAKTQWVAMSHAATTTAEDRAFEAVVLGETRPDASSAELIDAAVSRGEISPERGLVYGVYLACDAGLLPAEFRGQDAAPAERNILWEADVDWTSLSPDTRQALSDLFTAQAGDTASPCGAEIRRLADGGNVWWSAALRSEPSGSDDVTVTASRP